MPKRGADIGTATDAPRRKSSDARSLGSTRRRDLIERRPHVAPPRKLADVDAEARHEHRVRFDGLYVRRLERGDAGHRLLEVGRELLGLAAGTGIVPLLELGHDPIG